MTDGGDTSGLRPSHIGRYRIARTIGRGSDSIAPPSTALRAFGGALTDGSLLTATGFTLGLGALYGALYVILLSEQNALLMGSLLIFALLAGVMIGTRKVDWNALLAVRAVEKIAE